MKTTPSFRFDDLPVSLPTRPIPAETPLEGLNDWVKSVLTGHDIAEHLDERAVWRDWLSVTGSARTFNGAKTIASTWTSSAKTRPRSDWHVEPAQINRPGGDVAWIGFRVSFKSTTPNGLVGPSNGWVLIVPAAAADAQGETGWKIWVITTMLERFEGHGDPRVIPPETLETLTVSKVDDATVMDFSVIIIGGGQGGLSLAGRLAGLGVDYILLERQPEVGYAWWGKYDTVKQHTTKEYNNLPLGRTWTEDDPTFLPGAKVVEGFKNYVEKNKINVWRSADTESCSWDAAAQQWTLSVRVRAGEGKEAGGTGATGYGKLCTLRARHLCLGLGGGMSCPFTPELAGASEFKGEQMHSESYRNSRGWKGKRGIVVGTGTTGHDIAQDMLDNGLSSVTMIQRNKTAVMPIEWITSTQTDFYNTSIPTDTADDLISVIPAKVARDLNRMSFQKKARDEHERFEALEKAGFRIDYDTSLFEFLFIRYGGHYVDIGTSARIAKGDIKVKSGVHIRRFTEQGLEFEDGSALDADVIVFATGYDTDYRNQVGSIVGREIAERLDDFWGIDENGDLRGVMKPVFPGQLWLLAGAASQARFSSRFIALLIQEDLLQQQQQPGQSHQDSKIAANGHIQNGVH